MLLAISVGMRTARLIIKQVIIAGLYTLTAATVALCMWTGARRQGSLNELVTIGGVEVAHVQCCLVVTVWRDIHPPAQLLADEECVVCFSPFPLIVEQ